MSMSMLDNLLRKEHKLQCTHNRDAVTTVKNNIDKGEIMSKIKDQMERDHEREMEQYYNFMEWVHWCNTKFSTKSTKKISRY